MPMLFALATSVGVLAVVATWLFSVDPLAGNHLQIWQAFIAWGCHFHSGGKSTGTRNTIACMSFGSAIGMGAILLAGQLGSLGQLAAPVAVGLGAAVIGGDRAGVEAANPCDDSRQRLRLCQHRWPGAAQRGNDPAGSARPDDPVRGHRRGVRLRFGSCRERTDEGADGDTVTPGSCDIEIHVGAKLTLVVRS
jgi:hypothetical protein